MRNVLFYLLAISLMSHVFGMHEEDLFGSYRYHYYLSNKPNETFTMQGWPHPDVVYGPANHLEEHGLDWAYDDKGHLGEIFCGRSVKHITLYLPDPRVVKTYLTFFRANKILYAYSYKPKIVEFELENTLHSDEIMKITLNLIKQLSENSQELGMYSALKLGIPNGCTLNCKTQRDGKEVALWTLITVAPTYR